MTGVRLANPQSTARPAGSTRRTSRPTRRQSRVATATPGHPYPIRFGPSRTRGRSRRWPARRSLRRGVGGAQSQVDGRAGRDRASGYPLTATGAPAWPASPTAGRRTWQRSASGFAEMLTEYERFVNDFPTGSLRRGTFDESDQRSQRRPVDCKLLIEYIDC